jgi:hypothetical protein
MAQYLTLPNGSQFEIRQGETREQALSKALQQYPEAFGFGQAAPTETPESGFVPALKSGISSLKSDVAALAGRTGIMDQAAAEKYIQEQADYQKRTFKPTATFGEAPVTKTLELLGGSFPYMAAPIAAGALAPAGALALGAAGAASAAQFTGSNLSRQMGEGKALGETDITAAALAAVPQAALDALSLKMLPGIRSIFGQAGKEISKDVAQAIAQQSVKEVAKDYAVATGKAMGTEGLTEVGQQALERLQASLSLTDEKARDEYLESLIGGAVLGGVLSPAGRYVERGRQAKKEEADTLAAAMKQREADAKQREAALTSPEGRLAFVEDYEARQARFQELKDIAKPGKDATPLQQAEYTEIKKEKNDLGRSLYRDSAEYKKAVPIAQQLREQRRVDAMTPQEYQMEQLGLAPGLAAPPAAPTPPSATDELFSLYTQGAPATTAPKAEPVSPVNQYVAQQLNLASQSSYLKPEAADYAAYLLQNPEMAAQITTETPMPGLARAERNAVAGMVKLQLQTQAKEALQPRVEDLAGQVPKKAVGKRKAPDYEAYLQDLEAIDFDRREGQTAEDIANMEKLQRPTDVTAQGEMFGQPAQQTVLGEAPKTRRELLADLRVARVAGDRNAAEAIINSLRAVDKRDEADAARVAGGQQKFVLNGEQREELSAQGYSEEQIDEVEAKAQKSLGQAIGAGQTPLSTAIQQVASESRADAFSEVVDLVNRFNKGAAKQEQLDAAKERVVSGLLTDIRQSRQEPLTEEETRDITRNANELLRELTERFGDTRSLSQKGKDLFVPAQTRTGEFRTDEVPGTGYPTVESRVPGRQTFSSPFAAAQSIREGLEELRTRAITSAQAPSYTRTFTPREVSVDAAEAQLSRELAKDPQTHSPEQRRLLEAIGDNVRMMMRPETRQDVSSWLYDLARDPATVPTDKTQAVRDALQMVEQAKLSDQEQLGLPLGPGKKLRQEAPQVLNKPTPVQPGSFSQVSFEPEYEAATPTVFNSYAELKRYLASDALQEMRSAIGLARPTIDRLEQRVKPFAFRVALYLSKLDALKARVVALDKRVQDMHVTKREELETLKKMSAADAAAETRALNEAQRNLQELRKRMAELEAPLRKELEPLLKEFDTAQKQFDKAVAAEEALTAAMLSNNQLFGDRELFAIQKLHNVQQRMKNARSKLHKEFQEDFGNDPRNLARTMREFKESGKQGAFNEQLAKAHKELYDVFFDTRKDDVAIQQYLKTAAKLDAQIQEQAGKIDALGEKLLNAGVALEEARSSQLEAAENRDEILDARQQSQEAQQILRELEAKQQARLDALEKLEVELGLTRTEIPHRVSETTTVAEVLRASTASEKALIRQRNEAEAKLNEAAAPVKALFAFDRQRTETRTKKPETAAQTQERDAQRQRLLEAIGRDPASFDGERVSFEKRRGLIEELGTAEETRGELEALIAAADEAVPYLQQQIAEAEKALKSIDKEIAQVEAANKKRPRSFQAKLEQQSAMVALGPLREVRDRLAKSLQPYPPNSRPKDRTVRSLVEDLAAHEREKATAQSNLATLEERKADLEALFSDDPEVQKARTQAIDKRIAKVEKNIENQKASLKEKGIKASTLDSRKRELRKSFKELQRLMAQRSAKFGITRKALADVGRPETAAAEEGERLGARKVGPIVRPVRTAGNIRTGVAETTEERKLSTRSKITQGGKTKTETSKQAQAAGNVAAEARAAQQPEKTATQLAVEELQQQQQILAAKERLETSIRVQLADLDIRLNALRRSQRPNVLLIRDLEAQKSVLQRDLVAARMDVEREGALAAEAQNIVDTQSTVGGILSASFPDAAAQTPEETVPDDTAEALQTGLKSLSKDEVKTLETAYGAKKRTDTFLSKLQKDVVDMVNNGGKAVAKGIRNIIKKLSEGVLAVAMIFNPQFNATNFSFDLPKAYSQTITEKVSIKAQVPASAREQMSPLAQMVYENMAPTAKASGKGFGIVDKVNGSIHFFNNDGSVLVQGPALMGKDVGDVLGKSSLEGGPKITPAGRFTLEVSKDDFYGTSFNLLETFDSTGYVAIHPVYLGNLKENRLGRLQSPEATDNRVSYGCINTTKEMFVDKLAPNADALNGGMLFVLPDATERTAEMFPEKVETVTKTISGTEQTAKAESRSIVGREEKLFEGKTLFQVATEINNSPRVEVDPQKSAATLMASIAATSKTPLNRVVAERLKGLLGVTEVRIAKDLRNDQGGAVYGSAAIDGSRITLDADSGLNEQTILHEGVHAAIERVLRAPENIITPNQRKAKRELEALYKAYAADAAAPNDNAKESISEFVADALSDPAVQLYMQGKKWTLKHMWESFKNSILSMLGIETPSTMLEATLAAADRLMLTVPRPTARTTESLSRKKPKYASPEWASAGEDIGKVVARQRTWGDKIKANATGLAFETQLVDRFAAFERLRKYMPEQMGTQMMYYLRMYDQRMNFVSQAVSNGALRLAEKTRPDGKTEYLIESKEGANIGNVVQILRDAQPFVGNAEAVNQAFTTYLAALRADRVGLAKLNFGGSVTQEMLDRTMRMVNGNDKLKDVFEKARREYNAYNRDQIAMVAATGAISKETEAALTRTEDYIPFYRAQNGVVELLIGGEAPMRIGSIADQPYLQELVGGDQPILDFMTSSVQNTNMLVDMALRNLATKNAVFELVNLGAAKIVAGKPAGRDVVQFKVDGQDRYAVISSEKVTIGGKTFETGVPADILVKGMEGIPTQMPFLFRAMAMPAQLLRKAVTLSPLYMAKQLFRDSLAAPITSGANFTPVMGALRQIGKESGKALETRGITGGQYMTGSADDITKILRDISDGKPGWMSALSKAEAIGMKADALTRRAQYNSYIEQGMSEMEATLMALESMNFNKRGASPSIHVANALIPFFNAQIQGLNVLYKAMSGKMPFNDKLKIQQKLLMRGGMMAAASLLYAALMDDDEAYKNATPDQKYGNWFVRVPGVDQPIRVPVPFEIGYIFKALPEALYNSMTDKHGNEDAVKAFKQILLQSVPGGSSYGIPQIMKPAIEAGLGKSFYTGRDILSAREKELLPEDQFRANTAEISKVVGKAMGVSPIVMENLVRGYTGTMGLAFLHALSLGAPKSESPEAAVKRLSDYPIIGGSFQPNDAGGITNAVYERFNEDIKVRNSYKKMVEEGRSAEAKELLQRRGNEIMEAEIADVFKQNMNKLTQAERAIAASSLTPDQKRKQLDELRKLKTAISQTMRETADKTVKLSSPL